MKYTRYNPQKRNNKDGLKFLFMLILIVFVAFLIGTLAYKVLIKQNINNAGDTNKSSTENIKKDNEENVENSDTKFSFYGIQCGVFQNKKNADELSDKLKSAYNVFYGEKEDKYRVLVGIYEGDEGTKILQSLKDEGYNVAKVSLQFEAKDICDAEIGEIIKANLKLLNKLDEKEVESVETKDLKSWSEGLKEVNEENRNYEILKGFKEYISKLPEKLNRENSEENYKEIFSVIQKIQ